MGDASRHHQGQWRKRIPGRNTAPVCVIVVSCQPVGPHHAQSRTGWSPGRITRWRSPRDRSRRRPERPLRGDRAGARGLVGGRARGSRYARRWRAIGGAHITRLPARHGVGGPPICALVAVLPHDPVRGSRRGVDPPSSSAICSRSWSDASCSRVHQSAMSWGAMPSCARSSSRS